MNRFSIRACTVLVVKHVNGDAWLVNAADQFPGALSGSMGLKGAVSSGMEAYKCWSLCFLLPAGK